MQQRQLRLGDILDDYCPRERRVTNHAVVAMIGDEVRQTRCTTCDADHEYKHAKVPRQRRKPDTPAALYAQVAAAAAPKRIAHETPADESEQAEASAPMESAASEADASEEHASEEHAAEPAFASSAEAIERDDEQPQEDEDEGIAGGGEFESVHRPLIRATLPRHEGQQPVQRQAPDFTIRQPGGGRPGRFRPRNPRGGGQPFGAGNRGGGNGSGNFGQSMRGGQPRQHGGRPNGTGAPRPGRHRQGPPTGGKRSK